MEITVCSHHVPAWVYTVLLIIGRNMRVRFRQRSPSRLRWMAIIDIMRHALTARRMTELPISSPLILPERRNSSVEQEVELSLPGMGPLPRVNNLEASARPACFSIRCPSGGIPRPHPPLIPAKLVRPLGDAWHIIKFWRENRPFPSAVDQGLPVRAYPRAGLWRASFPLTSQIFAAVSTLLW